MGAMFTIPELFIELHCPHQSICRLGGTLNRRSGAIRCLAQVPQRWNWQLLQLNLSNQQLLGVRGTTLRHVIMTIMGQNPGARMVAKNSCMLDGYSSKDGNDRRHPRAHTPIWIYWFIDKFISIGFILFIIILSIIWLFIYKFIHYLQAFL